MTADDLVNLMIVLKSGNVLSVTMTRHLAAKHIVWWYDRYETVRRLSWWRFLFHLCGLRRHRPLAWAFNHEITEGAITSAAVDARQILALYTSECNSSPLEKLAAAQEAVADAIKRETKRGEEWRDGNDKEEDNEE